MSLAWLALHMRILEDGERAASKLDAAVLNWENELYPARALARETISVIRDVRDMKADVMDSLWAGLAGFDLGGIAGDLLRGIKASEFVTIVDV